MNDAVKHKLSYFLFIAFGGGWAMMLLGMFPGDNASYSALLNLYPFAPLLAVLIVYGFHLDEKTAGIRWKITKGEQLGWLRFAWLYPILLTAAGAVLYFILNPGMFDSGLGAMEEAMSAQNTSMDKYTLFFTQLLTSCISMPFFRGAAGLGQEVGWRGFLQPELEKKLGFRKSVILTGVISGLWYVPMICLSGLVFGTGYPGEPWLGVAVYCVYSVFISILSPVVYEKSGSILLSALLRGSFDAVGSIPVYLLHSIPDGLIFGPGMPGITTMIPLAVYAILVLRKAETD